MKNQLHEYLKSNRGVGHTRLLLDGALNARYPFIVIGVDTSQAHFNAKQIGNSFAIPIGFNNKEALRGLNHPVLIDNSIFTFICDDYERQIKINNETIANQQIQMLSNEKDITNIPFWIRLFTPIYKKRLKKILG